MNLGGLYQIILKSDKEISGSARLAKHAIFAFHIVGKPRSLHLPRCASIMYKYHCCFRTTVLDKIFWAKSNFAVKTNSILPLPSCCTMLRGNAREMCGYWQETPLCNSPHSVVFTVGVFLLRAKFHGGVSKIPWGSNCKNFSKIWKSTKSVKMGLNMMPNCFTTACEH